MMDVCFFIVPFLDTLDLIQGSSRSSTAVARFSGSLAKHRSRKACIASLALAGNGGCSSAKTTVVSSSTKSKKSESAGEPPTFDHAKARRRLGEIVVGGFARDQLDSSAANRPNVAGRRGVLMAT